MENNAETSRKLDAGPNKTKFFQWREKNFFYRVIEHFALLELQYLPCYDIAVGIKEFIKQQPLWERH